MTWFGKLSLVCLAALKACTAYGQSCGLPPASPEAGGFSAARLQRLDHTFERLTDEKTVAGAVILLARHGKVISCGKYGYRDLASRAPMQLDTIFRLASMSKPIVAAAMMILYEEGKWKPSDPVAKFIPELDNLEVFAGVDTNGKAILENPRHKPTIGELLTHTGGFTYGFFSTDPVDEAYRKINPLQASSSAQFIERLGKLPLLYQPGTRWVYSLSVDVQGVLIERLSGMSLPEFLRTRIFEPLGMKDTGFFVPAEKLSRLATSYGVAMDGMSLKPFPIEPGVTKEPGFASGGGGLYSTAHDYLRFAQMLLDKGELDGVRILAPGSVSLMTANHLADSLLTGQFGVGPVVFQPGLGYGYDLEVFEDPLKLGDSVGRGTFTWGGATGVWFWVDPTNDLVFVGMIQRAVIVPPGSTLQALSHALVNQPDFLSLSSALTYQALTNPGS